MYGDARRGVQVSRVETLRWSEAGGFRVQMRLSYDGPGAEGTWSDKTRRVRVSKQKQVEALRAPY